MSDVETSVYIYVALSLETRFFVCLCAVNKDFCSSNRRKHKRHRDERVVLRTAFTLSANKIESELKNDVVDLQKISLLQVQLKDKYLRLEAAQEAVSGTLLQLEDNGEEFETDFIDAESYREKYLEYYTRIDKKLGETVISEVPDTPRKFKLPKLELRKFSGE
ncbi:uncharacterized protein TNCV_4310321 [Trichonephila clavipes]|nr:uncharacterized protein TNCV_4310321 [Trichonephila clavipes]